MLAPGIEQSEPRYGVIPCVTYNIFTVNLNLDYRVYFGLAEHTAAYAAPSHEDIDPFLIAGVQGNSAQS